MATQVDFQRELDQIFRYRTQLGDDAVVVVAGDLHDLAQDGAGNRVPNCCRVMRKNMTPSDRILSAPPKGDGTRLQIEYKLPR